MEDRAPPLRPLSAGSIARAMVRGQRATRRIAAAAGLPLAVLTTCGVAASSCDLPPTPATRAAHPETRPTARALPPPPRAACSPLRPVSSLLSAGDLLCAVTTAGETYCRVPEVHGHERRPPTPNALRRRAASARPIQVGWDRSHPWILDERGELRGDGEAEPESLPGVRRLVGAGLGVSWTLDADGIVRRWQTDVASRAVRGVPRATDLVDDGAPCALARSGEVWCWDERESTRRPRGGAPGPVADLPPASQVIASGGLGCAISGGGLWCWKAPSVGIPDHRPFAVELPWPTRIRRIAGHGRGVCAVDERGSIRCAQLALRHGVIPCLAGDAREVAGVEGARDVAVLEAGACALLATGAVRCWGTRMDSPPTGGASFRDDFRAVRGLPPVASVALSRDLACAVTRSRAVWCWGANDAHQIDGSGVDRPTPRPVEGLAGVVRVGVANDYACALDAGGSVSCWGDHGRALTWSDEEPGRDTGGPRPIDGVGGTRTLVVGRRGACATDAAGAVRCWVNGIRPTPARVPVDAPLRDVTPMGGRFCAREGEHGVACWRVPLPGDGWRVDRRRLPGMVALLPSDHEEQCFLAADGAASCWSPGDPAAGVHPHINDDAEVDRLAAGGARLVLGSSSACTLFRDRRARCNAVRMDTSMRENVDDLAVAGDLICMAHVDGRVFCAGRNERGQLGDGAPSPDAPADAVVMP